MAQTHIQYFKNICSYLKTDIEFAVSVIDKIKRYAAIYDRPEDKHELILQNYDQEEDSDYSLAYPKIIEFLVVFKPDLDFRKGTLGSAGKIFAAFSKYKPDPKSSKWGLRGTTEIGPALLAWYYYHNPKAETDLHEIICNHFDLNLEFSNFKADELFETSEELENFLELLRKSDQAKKNSNFLSDTLLDRIIVRTLNKLPNQLLDLMDKKGEYNLRRNQETIKKEVQKTLKKLTKKIDKTGERNHQETQKSIEKQAKKTIGEVSKKIKMGGEANVKSIKSYTKALSLISVTALTVVVITAVNFAPFLINKTNSKCLDAQSNAFTYTGEVDSDALEQLLESCDQRTVINLFTSAAFKGRTFDEIIEAHETLLRELRQKRTTHADVIAEVHYRIGLLQMRTNGRNAFDSFKKASDLAPTDPLYAFSTNLYYESHLNQKECLKYKSRIENQIGELEKPYKDFFDIASKYHCSDIDFDELDDSEKSKAFLELFDKSIRLPKPLSVLSLQYGLLASQYSVDAVSIAKLFYGDCGAIDDTEQQAHCYAFDIQKGFIERDSALANMAYDQAMQRFIKLGAYHQIVDFELSVVGHPYYRKFRNPIELTWFESEEKLMQALKYANLSRNVYLQSRVIDSLILWNSTFGKGDNFAMANWSQEQFIRLKTLDDTVSLLNNAADNFQYIALYGDLDFFAREILPLRDLIFQKSELTVSDDTKYHFLTALSIYEEKTGNSEYAQEIREDKKNYTVENWPDDLSVDALSRNQISLEIDEANDLPTLILISRKAYLSQQLDLAHLGLNKFDSLIDMNTPDDIFIEANILRLVVSYGIYLGIAKGTYSYSQDDFEALNKVNSARYLQVTDRLNNSEEISLTKKLEYKNELVSSRMRLKRIELGLAHDERNRQDIDSEMLHSATGFIKEIYDGCQATASCGTSKGLEARLYALLKHRDSTEVLSEHRRDAANRIEILDAYADQYIFYFLVEPISVHKQNADFWRALFLIQTDALKKSAWLERTLKNKIRLYEFSQATRVKQVEASNMIREAFKNDLPTLSAWKTVNGLIPKSIHAKFYWAMVEIEAHLCNGNWVLFLARYKETFPSDRDGYTFLKKIGETEEQNFKRSETCKDGFPRMPPHFFSSLEAIECEGIMAGSTCIIINEIRD